MTEHPINIKKVETCNDTTTVRPDGSTELQVKLVLVTDKDEKLTLLFSQAAVGQMIRPCEIIENLLT